MRVVSVPQMWMEIAVSMVSHARWMSPGDAGTADVADLVLVAAD